MRYLITKRKSLLLSLAIVFGMPSSVAANPESTLFHIPPSLWVAGEEQLIEAEIEGDWFFQRIWVAFRPLGAAGDFAELDMERSGDTGFTTIIPAREVQPPGIEYYIAAVELDGSTTVQFASPQSPHTLTIHGETEETELADRLNRHHGNRSSLVLRGELSRYGRRRVESGETAEITERGSDTFWTSEVEYTYRLLINVVYEIRTGLGVMRGDYAQAVSNDGTLSPVGVVDGADEPGLNYGYAGVGLELARFFSVDLNVVFGASETGFAAGADGLVRVGRIADTRFEVGVTLMQDIGHQGLFRFAWHTVERFPMALTVELDERPSGDNPLATRLLYDLSCEVTEDWGVTGRIGYATRSDALEGGWVAGLQTGFEF